MRTIDYLILTILLTATANVVGDESSLTGKWELSDYFAELVPETCKGAYLEITDEDFKTISGEQVISAEYRVSYRGSDTLFILSNLSGNNKPNCQGYSSDFVLQNFAKLLIWSQEGSVVQVFAPQLLMEVQRVQTP